MKVFFQRTDFIIFFQGCLITSCLNGGFCLPDKGKQDFSCSCQQPWTGDRCEVKKGNFRTYLFYIQCADVKPTQRMGKTDISLASSVGQPDFPYNSHVHRNFNQKIKGWQGEISGTQPAQLTGLLPQDLGKGDKNVRI